METSKRGENVLRVTKTEVRENTYTFEFLTEQRARIQQQLDEVDGLLAECSKLGITTKAI